MIPMDKQIGQRNHDTTPAESRARAGMLDPFLSKYTIADLRSLADQVERLEADRDHLDWLEVGCSYFGCRHIPKEASIELSLTDREHKNILAINVHEEDPRTTSLRSVLNAAREEK